MYGFTATALETIILKRLKKQITFLRTLDFGPKRSKFAERCGEICVLKCSWGVFSEMYGSAVIQGQSFAI
jgi:hypothetical protein